MAAVGGPEVFLSKGLGYGSTGDGVHVQEENPVKVGGYGLQVVVDHGHRLALGPKPLQEVDDDLFRKGIHTLKGLVQKVQVCLLDQGPGEEDPLLLPPRELADLPVLEVGKAHLLQGL